MTNTLTLSDIILIVTYRWNYAEGWYWPEGIWWRSTEDSVSPQSDSKVSPDAWHETVWRMWLIHSCFQKTFHTEREQIGHYVVPIAKFNKTQIQEKLKQLTAIACMGSTAYRNKFLLLLLSSGFKKTFSYMLKVLNYYDTHFANCEQKIFNMQINICAGKKWGIIVTVSSQFVQNSARQIYHYHHISAAQHHSQLSTITSGSRVSFFFFFFRNHRNYILLLLDCNTCYFE